MTDSGPLTTDPPQGSRLDCRPNGMRWSRFLRWPWIYLLAVAAIAGTADYWGSRAAVKTCEQDGQAIVPELAADIQTATKVWHPFCSILCARQWLGQHPKANPEQMIVRDALTGRPLENSVAFFVESDVVTNPSNGNRVHAFQYRTDAAEHIRRFHGREVDDPLLID